MHGRCFWVFVGQPHSQYILTAVGSGCVVWMFRKLFKHRLNSYLICLKHYGKSVELSAFRCSFGNRNCPHICIIPCFRSLEECPQIYYDFFIISCNCLNMCNGSDDLKNRESTGIAHIFMHWCCILRKINENLER